MQRHAVVAHSYWWSVLFPRLTAWINTSAACQMMLWAALVLICLLYCLTIEETESMDLIFMSQSSFALVFPAYLR